MGTLVCFHAHPDDEALTTGGTMARAAAEGHRVVLVVATGGEHGEVPDDLGNDETLASRRSVELDRSAANLGVHRVVRLGYEDSGMTGWEQNAHPTAFARADVDEAAERLAGILREEHADVVVAYDWHGNYGHPDHVQVHRVGHRAADLAGTAHVYEATVNRDQMARMIASIRLADTNGDGDGPRDFSTDDGNPFGTEEAELTTAVDVTGFLAQKRASMAAHASQITDTSPFLAMASDVFAVVFGTEWFVHVGTPPGITESWLAGL